LTESLVHPWNAFSLSYLHMAPRDIDPKTPTKNSQTGGQPPTTDKSPTPDGMKMAPKPSKPPSSNGGQHSPSTTTTLNPTAEITPSLSATDTSHRSEPAKTPRENLSKPQSQ
jgi:hypothetical protein